MLNRILGAIFLCLLVGCNADVPESSMPAKYTAQEQADTTAMAVPLEGDSGETVYVPVYSHIYHQGGSREFNLTATLSIRNTDLDAPIVITSVRYYDSEGQLVRLYLEQPLRLLPLASQAYVVEERDKAGGVGANFVVQWQAEGAVSPPIIEAVMISTAGTQGLSFVSRGQVVR